MIVSWFIGIYQQRLKENWFFPERSSGQGNGMWWLLPCSCEPLWPFYTVFDFLPVCCGVGCMPEVAWWSASLEIVSDSIFCGSHIKPIVPVKFNSDSSQFSKWNTFCWLRIMTMINTQKTSYHIITHTPLTTHSWWKQRTQGTINKKHKITK